MLSLPLLLLLTPLSVLARPTMSPRSSPSIHLIYEFSDFRLENLAQRSNGHLLLTASNQPYLYDIDPHASSPKPKILPKLSDVGSIFGIAETAPDVFAVAAGNYTTSNHSTRVPGEPTSGSFSVWTLNMTAAEPIVKLITAIPEAELLNGAAALNGFTGTVLIADSILGAIWKVDVATGDYSKAVQNSAFAPNASEPVGDSFGINGLRIFREKVYFTNSAQGTFARIPVNSDGSAAGDVEILARTAQPSLETYDDLDMDPEGNVWIASHSFTASLFASSNIINEVTPGGVQTNLTSTSFLLPTSARFGFEGELYVVNYGNSSVSGQLVVVSNLP